MAKSVKDEPKEKWANQVEYLLSCLGYAVGLGNVWRFPYLCYKNGGGAFLIPYFLTLFLCGIPLVFLETTLGQFSSSGCISLFNITPIFKGAGYAVIVLNSLAVTYFGILMSYTVLFLVNSFHSPLPWESCDHNWNTESCIVFSGNSTLLSTRNSTSTTPEEEFFYKGLLKMSPSIHEIGGIVWPVFYANLFCWTLVFLCICRGVKSVGKIVYFTVLFPYVVLSIMFVRGITLTGAWEGLKFYLYPNWHELSNPRVWADGAIQIFYSLGPGWGGLVSMASFNNFHYDNLPSSVIVPLINSGTSIFAGFVVFSTLGFAAVRAGVSVGAVANAGPGLAFVTYPAALSMMRWPNFWAVIFFFMLLLLSIDTMFVTIEAVVAGVMDEFPHFRRKKTLITFYTCCVLFSLSIMCTTEGGMHVVELLDSHVAGACVPLVCLLELVSAVYVYGSKKLSRDVDFMTGRRINFGWIFLWKFLNPALLLIVMIYTLWSTRKSNVMGWAVLLAPVVLVPAHVIRVLANAKGSLKKRIKECSKPADCWGPADEQHRDAWLQRCQRNIPLIDMKI